MNAPDPYRPPRAATDGAELTAAHAAPLYSLQQMTVATVIGTPMAGAIMLAANYRALGNQQARNQTILWGFLATAAVMVLAFVLPDQTPNMVLPIVYTIAFRTLATQLQGRALATLAFRQSNLRVAGIALGALAGVVAVTFAVVAIWELAAHAP